MVVVVGESVVVVGLVVEVVSGMVVVVGESVVVVGAIVVVVGEMVVVVGKSVVVVGSLPDGGAVAEVRSLVGVDPAAVVVGPYLR